MKNICYICYLHSAGRWSDDEVAMYLLTTINKQTILNKTNEQRKVVQEVASPEVPKLNHTVMNKKQGDQMQFHADFL